MSSELKGRYQQIRKKIPESVTLVAVSKTQPASMVQELFGLGQRDFGENYVQELVAKAEELERLGLQGIRWHFIGHLQTNKVKALIRHVSVIHSLDSEKLAQELGKRWRLEGRPGKLPVFIETNLGGEASKSGVDPAAVPSLARSVSRIPELELQGLMCIPSPKLSPQLTRSEFEKLRELELKCRPDSLGKLSMGMSSDFELAISEGATHVRIGTSLFGLRKP